MALTDEILALRDRALAELAAVHDYYADTTLAWRVVLDTIQAGYKLTNHNLATGTVTTEADLAARAHGYVARDLAQATFQQFVAIFESFFFDFLRLWLAAYPQSLGAKEIPFKVILDAPDKDAITLHVVNRELTEVAYRRPREWFAYLDTKVKLGCPAEPDIERIGEIKATRDVLAHNRGVANKLYESRAGAAARYKDGDTIDVPEPYHQEAWELLRKVVGDMANAAHAKLV